MRRITIWLTATLAVVAMATYYQASLSGGGKHSEAGGTRTAVANCSGPRQPSTTSGSAPSRTSPDGAQPLGGDTSADPCAGSDHAGKPGESK